MNRSKPVSFTLGTHDCDFIEDMVANGRFGNKTEVVRAGLRLLQDYESNQKLNRLRAEIAKGDSDYHSGRTFEFTTPDEMITEVLKGQ